MRKPAGTVRAWWAAETHTALLLPERRRTADVCGLRSHSPAAMQTSPGELKPAPAKGIVQEQQQPWLGKDTSGNRRPFEKLFI